MRPDSGMRPLAFWALCDLQPWQAVARIELPGHRVRGYRTAASTAHGGVAGTRPSSLIIPGRCGIARLRGKRSLFSGPIVEMI